MKNDIEKVADGDLSFNVSLDKRDDFKNISGGCNRMIGSFRDKFSVLKVKMHDMNGILEGIEHVKDKQALTQKTQLLIDALERLEKEV
ncbi:hypothetical protein [Dissulfurispira sp.]|uniref:hypothetical protein n=1 Tax=Dissulfurispira sp. TaxID=2817609 RepID=UPI002FDAED52